MDTPLTHIPLLTHKHGEQETAPVPFYQSIEDFIEGLHSRSSFSRELIGQQQAADLDQQVRDLLLPYHPGGVLPLHVVGTVIWGAPESGTTLTHDMETLPH